MKKRLFCAVSGLICTLSLIGCSESPISQNDIKTTDTTKVSTITVKSVSSGQYHSLILKSDGTLWGCGRNYNGQLGLGTSGGNFYEFSEGVDQTSPVLIMRDVASMSAGSTFSMILKTDGTLWAMGENQFGQLGDGTLKSRNKPVQIMTDVKVVSAGSLFTMILKNDGTLWATGNNYYGQLGTGIKDGELHLFDEGIDQNTPVQIMSDVQEVEAGGGHTMIIKRDGSLWGVGSNHNGQLGNGTILNKGTPVKIIDGVKSVVAAGSYTMIIKDDATLWGTGINSWGQLGNGTKSNSNTPIKIMADVRAVSARDNSTFIIKTDSSLWATGYTVVGLHGDGTTQDKTTPVQVMSNVASVSVGSDHTLFVKNDGSLWSTGDNRFGQLGDGTKERKLIAKKVL